MTLHTYTPQPMSLPSMNFLHLTVSEIQPGQTISRRKPTRPPAHPDTMGENNTPTALKGCGVKTFLDNERFIFILFGPRTLRAELSKFFPVNILGKLLSPAGQLGTWFDSDIPSLSMSGIPVRLVSFISGNLSDSCMKGISCMKLLFWLQTSWLEVI